MGSVIEVQTETSRALFASWEKWQCNASCLDVADAKTGQEACPLCNLSLARGCSGCPVARETGEAMCRGTSYGQAFDAKKRVLAGLAPIEAFHGPAQEYADLLERLWRAG
jgi:hypothetical protein